MKDYELLDAVGGIKAAYVSAADCPATQKRMGRRFRWIAAAACLCLAVGLLAPHLGEVIRNKGGFVPSEYDGIDSPVHEIQCLEYNGAYYEATDIPEALTRFGLPAVMEGSMAGRHLSYLQSDGGAGYTESAEKTDIELLEYAPAPSRGVYLVRDGNRYLAAIFCNIIPLDSNMSTGIETLYQFYGIESAGDIASIAEVDWNRSKVLGEPISDLGVIAAFYSFSKTLIDYGNDSFQAEVFDGIPEEQQPEAHTKFADDLRMLRLETKDGLCFYIEVHPGHGWIYGRGTLSYYRINAQMAAWIVQNLE